MKKKIYYIYYNACCARNLWIPATSDFLEITPKGAWTDWFC